jgi:hypothetical protein
VLRPGRKIPPGAERMVLDLLASGMSPLHAGPAARASIVLIFRVLPGCSRPGTERARYSGCAARGFAQWTVLEDAGHGFTSRDNDIIKTHTAVIEFLASRRRRSLIAACR